MGMFKRINAAITALTASDNQSGSVPSNRGRRRKPIEEIMGKPAALDNVIVFINGYGSSFNDFLGAASKHSLDMLAAAQTCAEGMRSVGYSVCVVQRDKEWSNESTVTSDSGLSSEALEYDEHFIRCASEVKVLSRIYDFVIVVDGKMSSFPDAEVWNRWKRLGTRFIIPHAGVEVPASLLERTACIYLGVKSVGFLSVDYNGDVIAHHSTKKHDITRIDFAGPVLAYYHPHMSAELFAAAITGVSDPRLHYADHYDISHYQNSMRHLETFFYGVIASIMGGGVGFTAANMTGSGMAASLGLVLPICTVSASFMRDRKKAKAFLSSESAAYRNVKHIFPFLSDGRVVRPLSISALPKAILLRIDINEPIQTLAPKKPVASIPTKKVTQITSPSTTSHAMYASDLMWAKVVKRHDAITHKWAEYEFDITKMLDAPLITDYSCPQTAALHVAAVEAADLKSIATDATLRGEQSLDVARTLYAESVTRLEVAFQVAETYAIKQGIRGFAEAEQRKIARSKQLFAIAFNASASDTERASAITQARKMLDGVIVINERAVQSMLEAAAVRPLINA